MYMVFTNFKYYILYIGSVGTRKMAPQFRSQGIGYIRLGDDFSMYGVAFLSVDAGNTFLDYGIADVGPGGTGIGQRPPPLVTAAPVKVATVDRRISTETMSSKDTISSSELASAGMYKQR